jgi:sugar (pentulose or hexulose) kinase
MIGLSLGIDVGTSGVRTAVLDETGAVLSSVKTNHLPQETRNIDATKWWLAVKDCIVKQGEALSSLGYDLKAVRRLGVDGTSGSMVLTDAALRPVTAGLMYDSSGFNEEADKIAKYAPDIHITNGSNSALARALRLQAQDLRGDAVHLLHQADLITAHLLGYGGISDENNTLKLGYDPETRRWPDWFEKTGLRTDLLPKVVPAGARLDMISPTVADELGMHPDTNIYAGTTDSIAAFLAAAPLEVGNAVTSLGTTLAIKILSDRRIDLPEMGLYSHKVGNAWLVGGASNTGGGVLAKLFDGQNLAELSAQIDPTIESSLDYYPLTKPGERFPLNDPLLRPRLTPRPPSDVAYLHGILESIARIERTGYEAIARQGGPRPMKIFTAGGGASNPIWTAIRARVMGIKLRETDNHEACVGTAKLIMAT